MTGEHRSAVLATLVAAGLPVDQHDDTTLDLVTSCLELHEKLAIIEALPELRDEPGLLGGPR